MKRAVITLPLLAFLTTACILVAGVQPIKVEGTAMLPALRDGDRILIDREFDELNRGDIVVFYFPADQTKSYIKRVIGLPGESVEIRDGEVFINGNALAEPYLDPNFNQSKQSLQAVELTADNYFVIGDNRDNSSDSRIWGPLQKKFIYGKYTRKYFSAE